MTTDATIPAGTELTAHIRARMNGRIAGLDAAAYALKLVDVSTELELHKQDGDQLEPGDVVAVMRGEARSILIAERTVLNFLGR